MENLNGFMTPKKSPASLTALRLKRVQHFRIVSSTDPERYGQLGSSKWGDELHRFLADKRIAREDVQRWMETNSQVTEPLPEIRKSEPQTENVPELCSSAGRALGTCRLPEVIQIQRPPSSSSSSSSSDSQNTGETVVSAKTFNSAKYPNNDASTNPIFLNDAPTPASGFNAQESGIHNFSTASRTSQSETQNDSMPLDLSNRSVGTSTVQQPEVTPQEAEILKDMAIGFGALYTLAQISQKYEQIPRSFLITLQTIYKRLDQFQQFSVVPRIREPFVPEFKQQAEMNPEYVEVDEEMDSQYFGTMEEINLVTDTESTHGNIMDTQGGDENQAIGLSMESNHGDIGGNFMNNQDDNDQMEENDLEGINQAENIDFSRYPNITVTLVPISGSQQHMD